MTSTQETAIVRHGQQLLAIFPDATERDPVKLCKKLRRLESQAHAIAMRLCNGPEYGRGEVDTRIEGILQRVNGLLGNAREQQADGTWVNIVPIFANRDPRGYALKIDDEYMRAHNLQLHRDLGGYGIIAPEIGKDGN